MVIMIMMNIFHVITIKISTRLCYTNVNYTFLLIFFVFIFSTFDAISQTTLMIITLSYAYILINIINSYI